MSKITYLPAALEKKEKELDEYKLILMYREREIKIKEIILERKSQNMLFHFIMIFCLGASIASMCFIFYMTNS